MSKIRIIPRLDIKGPNVIKGVRLECLRVVGNPLEFAKRYYESGADELLYIDIVASLYNRNNLSEIVKSASQEIFIPLTVGGGIRTIEDIRNILRAGADKVAINTAATKTPELITKGAKIFGAQCMVGSIEAKKIKENKWEAFTENGRERTGLDAVEWAQKLVELGAGELLVTSVDKEGTESGYDLELIKQIATKVSVPVIASGGAGSVEDMAKCVSYGKATGISMASLLHYNKLTVSDIKKKLMEKGISVRNSNAF